MAVVALGCYVRYAGRQETSVRVRLQEYAEDLTGQPRDADPEGRPGHGRRASRLRLRDPYPARREAP